MTVYSFPQEYLPPAVLPQDLGGGLGIANSGLGIRGGLGVSQWCPQPASSV